MTRLATRLYASSADASKQSSNNIAIVGGGLAGLGLAHALLEQQAAASICIYDTIAQVGQGGASAVAGGYVLLCFRS
jgi:glycine/D-amino acid oxidase-like deaminating enzyme